MNVDLPTLIEQFGSEDRCHDYIAELRWPEGVRCPRCGTDKVSRIVKRRQFNCGEQTCKYQFSVRTGTLFHDSHLPLWKWFLAVYLLCEAKKGVSANQLKRTLGVSYKTAWYLSHRIRAAMGLDGQEPLSGTVEADETWVGGKHKGAGQGQKKRQMVMGAVQRDGEVRLRIGAAADRKTLHGFLNEVVADEASAIYTDSWKAYIGIGDANTTHESVNHFRDEWVRGQVHTQTIESVWSLFKRGVVGSYHHMSVKHLPAYLDETEWRYNNRDNEFLFRDTLLKLIEGDTLTFRELVDKSS